MTTGFKPNLPTLDDLPAAPPGRTGWPWTVATPALPPVMPDGAPWPRVTVVTPSYNQGEFLEETIRSVLLQGYPNLEYIIMDGGSTDQSVAIMQQYTPWLAHWVSERDGGQANAINQGWQIATGDAITWLNSDDTLEPGALAAAVKALYAEPPVGIVHGKVNRIDPQSRMIGTYARNRFTLDDVVIRALTPFPQPGFLMKRQLLDEVGWLDESLQFCMDFDLWTRLALHNVKARYVDVTLANFRRHASSKTETLYKRQIREHRQIYEKVFSSSQADAALLAQRDRARGFVELNAAKLAYHQAKDADLIRIHALQHIRFAKLNSSPRALFLLMGALGGRWGLKFGERLNILAKRAMRRAV